jgi:hypothetical protein
MSMSMTIGDTNARPCNWRKGAALLASLDAPFDTPQFQRVYWAFS